MTFSALSFRAKHLCGMYVSPGGLHPLLASRLIALDKNPCVRPIGVGDFFCCLLGKTILNVIGPDMLDVPGLSQLCAGHLNGCKAVVHAVR